MWISTSYPRIVSPNAPLRDTLKAVMENVAATIADTWSRTLALIKERMSDPIYFEPFFQDTHIDHIEGKVVYVVAGTEVAAKTLSSSTFLDLANQALQEVTESDFVVQYITPVEATKSDKKSLNCEYFAFSRLNSAYTFKNFVAGASNREAYGATIVASERPGELYNPVLIYGNSGLGKTHLLQAIGNAIREKRPDLNALYITSHDFVEEYTRYLRGEKTQSFVDWFKQEVDVLLVDDIQFFAKKPSTEETFFAIFNAFQGSGKQIVLTSDQHPYKIDGLSDRLKTRFVAGLPVSISAPEKEVCETILKLKIEANNLDINNFDPEVISYFAEKFGKNIRELEGAFARLLFHAVNLFPTKHIDLKTAIAAVNPLADVRDDLETLSIEKVISTVASMYGLTSSQLTGKIRTAQIALARHIAMYMCRSLLDAPFAKIGAAFGGRDHTTVINGVEKVEKSLKDDPDLRKVVKRLETKLKG